MAEVAVAVIVSSSGTVAGMVRTAYGTGSVPYAQVKLSMSGRPDAFTTSDADGAFSFSYVPLGGFRVEVYHPGTGRVGRALGSVDYSGHMVHVDVRLIAQGTVEGFVYTASGLVVPGARVEIRSSEFGGSGSITLTSNLEGRFRASGIPEGNYHVTAFDEVKKLSGSATGRITAEGEVVRTDIHLEATGSISGRVFAADGFTPVPYAEVALSGGGGGSTVTDFEGNYSFPSVRLGTYTVTAKEQSGFDGGQGSGTVSREGQIILVNIVFIGTGNIQGNVVRADGQPLEREAVLTLKRSGLFGGAFTGYSDLEGNFSFYGIPIGDFSITAKLPDTLLGGAYTGRLTGDGTPVTITAAAVDSPDLYTVDFWAKGQLAQTVMKAPYAITITPVETVTVTAVPTDYSGNMGQVVPIMITVTPNGPPTVAIASPSSGTVIGTGGSVTVKAQAADDLGLKQIELRVRSADISFTQAYVLSSGLLTASHDFTFTLPTTAKAGNDITVEAVSTDTRGLDSQPAAIVLRTEDKTAPSVRITSFSQGFHVKPGETVPVTVYASDNWAVSRIDFRTEGGLVVTDSKVLSPPAIDGTATFSLTIPAGHSGGTKITIAPSATDTSGNVGYAPKITLVTDDISPPTIAIVSPGNGASVVAKSVVAVSARATDNDVIDRVEFFADGKLFATDRVATNGIYDAGFLVPAAEGSSIVLSAKAYDAAGNASSPASITVSVAKDTTPPAVTIPSNPAGMRFAEGHTVSISANVTDNTGVALVELLVNSKVVSSIQNPTSISLTITYLVESLIPEGMTSVKVPLEVTATDFSGNKGTSGVYQIEITRDNPPTITILSPRAGQDVLGGAKVRIQAVASDDFGANSVELKVNGTSMAKVSGSTITFDFEVPTSALGSTFSIEAVAVDTLGKSTSSSVEVNVPLSVHKVSEIGTGGEVTDAAVHNGYAYVFEKGKGISVIDVREAASPVKAASLAIQGYYTGLDVFEGVVYIYGASGLTMIVRPRP